MREHMTPTDRLSTRARRRAGRALAAAGLLTALTLGPIIPSAAQAAQAATGPATAARPYDDTATATAATAPTGDAGVTGTPSAATTPAATTPAATATATPRATATARPRATSTPTQSPEPTLPRPPKNFKATVRRTNGYEVGAYYFSGWSHGQNNNLTPILTRGPLSRYEPMISWYDDSQAQVDRNINQAVGAGINFFAFDYYDLGQSKYATDRTLNEALGYYLTSQQRARINFCLTFIDQAPFQPTARDWPRLVSTWIQYFKQPDYVRVNGKPLFIIFSPEHMRDIFGNSHGVLTALSYLRLQVSKAKLPGVTIAVGATVNPHANPNHVAQLKGEGYDITTGYNYHANGDEKYRKPVPYSALVQENRQMWDRVAKTYSQPYMPVITSGWDQRFSYREQKTAIIYAGRTPAQFGCYAAAARQWVDKNAKRTVKEKIVLIFAWNESGEGGAIIPTKADRGAYTDALSRVFNARTAPVCK